VPNLIEMTKSDLVAVLSEMLDPCSSLLPGEEPIPGTIPPDPEACAHWRSMLAAVRATDVAIDRMLGQQRLGEALGNGGATAALQTNRSDVQRLVDDVCGTPPRWPLPWPPPRRPLGPDALTGAALLMVGTRFQAAAEQLQGNALQSEFTAAADRLFVAGLERVAGRRAARDGSPRLGFCEWLEKGVMFIEQDIARKERHIEVMHERIDKLKSAPNPDLALIAELEGDIRELETELESDRPQLMAFREEFSASCGPR
jgi:hypothetical protein